MTDYATQLNTSHALGSKLSAGAALTDDHGHRQPPLDSGAWQYDNQAQTHHCDANTVANPINAAYRMDDYQDFLAALQHLVHYLNYLVNWPAATSGYKFNNRFYSNFAARYSYTLVSAAGSTLTLARGAVEPSSVLIFSQGGREGFLDPLTYTDTNGVGPQPGDLAVIAGNSVLAGRVQAKVVSVVADEGAGPNFTVTVDQPVSNADVEVTVGGDPITVDFYRNGGPEPELWTRPDPFVEPFWAKRYTITVAKTDAEWDEVGEMITIKHPDGGADTGIAWPMADREAPGGGTALSNLEGTFKFELVAGAQFIDITNSLRRWDAARNCYVWYPLVNCTHDGATGLKTTIDVSGIVPAAVTSVRITLYAEKTGADRTAAGVLTPCLKRCNHCTRDYTGTIDGVNASANGVGTDSRGWKWYCARRQVVPKANLDVFRAAECYQFDCPQFCPADRPPPDERVWAELLMGMGEWLKQLAPGNINPTNFVHGINTNPSIYWLLNHPQVYSSFYGGWSLRTVYYAGGFYYYGGIVTDANGNESIKFIRGPDFAHDHVDFLALNYDTNRNPAELRGVLRQRLGVSNAPHVQVYRGQAPDAATDPSELDRAFLGGRMPAPVGRLVARYGAGFVQSGRSVAGIEGENRVQRFNRGAKKIIRDLVVASSVAPNPDPNDTHFQFFQVPKTIGSKSDIKAVVQVRRDGPKDWGTKRVGPLGFNARAQRVEDLGGGDYRLHCYLTLFMQHSQAAQQDIQSPFFASGGLADMPHPYKWSASHYNSQHNMAIGGPRRRASAGDTVDFTDLDPAAKFYIKRVEAAGGDDLSAINSTRWVMSGVVGSFFDFASYLATGLEDIVISKVEVEFLGGGYQEYFGVGNPAVKFTPYEDRPTENSQTPGDLLEVFLDQDRFLAPIPSGTTATITAITDGGPPNNPPQIVTAAAHGLVHDQQVVITGSDSVPNIDGTWRIILIDPTTFLLNTALFKTNPITTPGAAGTVYPNTELFIQGAMNAYPSFESYRAAFSTSAGILTPNYRITFQVDGQAQQTLVVALKIPNLAPPLAADTSNLAGWVVTATDDRVDGGEPFTLTYQGTITNEFDVGPFTTFRGWWWNATDNKIYFHPNLAGANVTVEYDTTQNISFGDPPTGVAVMRETASTAYRTKADILDIVDEMGVIATLGAAAFEDRDFTIGTDGVILHGGLGGSTFGVQHRTSGSPPGAWSALGETTHFHVHAALGRYYLNQTAFDLLAATTDLETSGDVASTAEETPAELLQMTVRAIDAVDTVNQGFGVGVLTGFGIVSFNNTVGFSGVRDDPNWPGNDICTGPLKMGLSKFLIDQLIVAGEDRVNNIVPPGGDPNCKVYDDFQYQVGGSPLPGTILGVGAGIQGVFGRVDMGLLGLIFEFNWPTFWQRLPPGSEIVDARLQVTIGPNTNVRTMVFHFDRGEAGTFGEAPGVDPGYTPPADTDTTNSSGIKLTWAIAGLRNDGRWQTLGVADELSTAGVTAGQTRVIEARALVELLLNKKDSQYTKIGLFPAGVAAGDLETTIDLNGATSKDLINTIRQGYVTLTEQNVYTDPGNGLKRYDYEIKAEQFTIDSLSLGAMMIQFKLPSGVVGRRLTYGNWPAMQEIT